MDQPSKEEIRVFLAAFDKLDSFEAQQRTVRGHGAFNPNELPIPACVTVVKWLRVIATQPDCGTAR